MNKTVKNCQPRARSGGIVAISTGGLICGGIVALLLSGVSRREMSA